MSKSIQHVTSINGGLASKSLTTSITGLVVGLALSAFSVTALAADTTPQGAGRGETYQSRYDAEVAAERQRGHDHAQQEIARRDELELTRLRALRAKARDAARNEPIQTEQ